MTSTQKLNELAKRAKENCLEALHDLYRHYLPIIQEKVMRIWYKVKNDADLECECVRSIEDVVHAFDERRGSFDNLFRARVELITRRHLSRKGGPDYLQSIDQAIETKDGEMIFEIIDKITEVEGEVMARELIDKLSEGDDRNITILEHWADGLTNDARLSRIVSEEHGGKPQSQRVYINRFRERCKKLLQQLGYSVSKA